MPNWNPALDCAGAWFLHSGIQHSEGGVARYYRSDIQKNARVSTEITGYAVSFLTYLYRCTANECYLEAAQRAARFLITHAWHASHRLFPFEHSFNGSQPDPLAYFFDSGIIVRGLLALWRITAQTDLLDTAIATGHGMIEHFSGNGALHPILELPSKKARAYEPRWSAEPGCYQLKSAMAWHDLFGCSGEAPFRQAYEASLEQALANDPVFLPGTEDREKVMDRLHAYCYYLEGLLPCAAQSGCAAAIRAGVTRTSQYLREIEPEFARSDVYAQLLRVRLFAHQLCIAPLDVDAARYEADRAAAFQFASGGIRFHGGYGFGRKRGEMLPFVNPVSTAFCAQAIQMWSEYNANTFKTSISEIV
ncbi:MAG: hypothetical protein JO022_18390 [Acidobacteriaceae bacterium]|nr:hypothetical protein [Acidobacteriaceae bacterium]